MAELFDGILTSRQEGALSMLRASLRAGHKRPVVMGPTGFGKTLLAEHVAAGLTCRGFRSAFTVPSISLINQTLERFIAYGMDPGDIGVIQANHPHKRPAAPVQICSVQTLDSRGEFPLVDYVQVDECHVSYAIIARWMEACPQVPFIGWSATPWARGMANRWDDLLIPATIKQLIAEGALCKFRVMAPSDPDLEGIGMRVDPETGERDYAKGELSERMRRPKLVADVVQTWLDKAERRPTLVYAVDIAHARALLAQFHAVGINAAMIDGSTPDDERDRIGVRFHDGRVPVVVSVGTMIAGVDWDVRCISFARPTQSEILFVQAFGRGLRTAPGKDYLLFLDHSGTTKTLGLPTEIHYTELRDGKLRDRAEVARVRKQRQPTLCPRCTFLIGVSERECANCGYIPQRRCNVEVDTDRELVELGLTATQKRNNRTFTSTDKIRFYGELLMHAREKGYKQGWAANKYRERFGVWPNAYRDADPVPVSDETRSWLRGTQIRYIKGLEAKRRREVTAQQEDAEGLAHA